MHLLLVIFLVLSPFLFWLGFRSVFVQRRKKGMKAVREVYHSITARHALSISDVDVFGNRLIAIDKHFSKLVMVVHRNAVTWETCVDTSNILFCRVIKEQQEGTRGFRRVRLEITLDDAAEPLGFVFFEEEADDRRELPYRVQRAQFWKRLIQLQLSFIQVSQKVN
ncbi:hypothetical protein [Flavihumibacter petaseus]|uniref:Uncharacterized protein n=1 Tax=Flavihumibacter petaseus NBRC 106054 TaxID=1220578 RepID=A0A0E9N3U2_9BACT|nr:hypothetical protein [Flavihumibacter petaseus]GAO44030.1 hypothetical protein FPE01S_03_00700 [Flavihumibacter petaseus NBRC 106054]